LHKHSGFAASFFLRKELKKPYCKQYESTEIDIYQFFDAIKSVYNSYSFLITLKEIDIFVSDFKIGNRSSSDMFNTENILFNHR